MKKLITFLLAAVVLASAHAQQMSWDLAADYAITWNNDGGLLRDKYTIAQVQGSDLKNGGRPELYKWAKAKGWTDAEILRLGDCASAAMDVMWRGQGGDFTGQPFHAWNITYPHGRYPITYPIPVGSGQYIGQGSKQWDQANAVHGFGGTTLYLDSANWIAARSADRFIFRTVSWGQAEGYTHAFLLAHFNLDGAKRAKWLTPGYVCAGVAIWDCGETSKVEDIYAHDFDGDGFLFVRATPGHVSSCASFTNNRSGAAFIGCSGATITFDAFSGDDCPVRYYVRPGYDRGGGILLTASGATKSETGLSWQFAPYKAEMLLDAEGWTVFTSSGESIASATIHPDCVIRVKADPGTTSSVSVRGLRLFGNRRSLLHDVVGKKKYMVDKGTWGNPWSTFEWTSYGGGQWWSPWGTPLTVSAPFEGRLGYLPADPNTGVPIGTWDDVNGIPCWDYSRPCSSAPVPPPTCTWVLGTETCPACTTGQASVTCRTPYVSSVTGCTPTTAKPADQTRVQQCSAPPPTGSVIETVSNWTNASASYGVAKAWTGTRTLTFTELRPNALNYQMICNNGSKGIVVLPNGSMVLNTSGSDEVLLPAGTLKVGTAWSGTVTLPRAVDFTRFGALPGAGNAFLGSIKTMVVSK